ncbi:unnamed protein product, partial [Mesorhabditis belari]|uniref:Uncharacterized protein n=1 Tax=Mesorhabditis belari TaxID=2138241 RepID=A0AAF3EXW9_9BILA
MNDDGIRVPDVPLARCEDDIDSNRNSQPDESSAACSVSDESALDGDLSGSLEDLVGNLDQKIVRCLKDLGEKTEDIAPVQVRSQDEVMAESQIWWTLTGNFGTMMPLDFQNSQIRRNMVSGLGLRGKSGSPGEDNGVDLSDEDELRHQMDMHTLAAHGLPFAGDSPPQTADQVIEEIDEMLQSCDLSGSMMTDRTMESVDSMYSSLRSPFPSALTQNELEIRQRHAQLANPDDLEALSYSKLITLHAEMEQLIQLYNESLVEELAHRDELEYEKEMKNSFISLLLSIQNKRRQFLNERKRKGGKIDPATLPQYMTASIPFNEGIPPDNATLASLIKILKAINEDSPAVPSMLTEYILTVVCPSPKMASSIVC